MFIYRRVGDSVNMLSVIRPKCKSYELSINLFKQCHPLSFSSDLIITKTKFVKGCAGKRYDIRDNDERREWLKNKLSGSAELKFARFNNRFITLGNGTKRLIASVTGVIYITNVSCFVSLVQSGIGRGKAFGCGLIYIPEIMG